MTRVVHKCPCRGQHGEGPELEGSTISPIRWFVIIFTFILTSGAVLYFAMKDLRKK